MYVTLLCGASLLMIDNLTCSWSLIKKSTLGEKYGNEMKNRRKMGRKKWKKGRKGKKGRTDGDSRLEFCRLQGAFLNEFT